MTLDQAATLMGVTTRHTRRILAAYRERGAAAVAHGHRGRKPANATPEPVATAVVHLARTRYAGTNHTHLSELLSDRDGIDIGRTTLRRILVNAGLSSPRRRRPPKHRVRRQRMPREGMLIQGLVQHLGLPVALYTDRHGVFRHTPGSGLPGMPTQFSRAMEELGIQMIFALSPQAKGRVERTAGTFQDRLVTELRLAGASGIGEANRVLDQFLPRFNRRFRVPSQHPESAFRPLSPELCLEQVLCFKHCRKVARDNTVRFQLPTLQLLPGPERPSYAGAAVEVLEGLDGRLSVRHEGRILAAQEAPPSPVFLRNGHERSATSPVAPSGAHGLGERWTATLKSQDSGAENEKDQGDNTGSVAAAGKPKAASPRKPTFLERERWKAIQKARRKGMSLRAIERELGIHRATVRKYLDTEGSPTRRPWVGHATSTSDTMAP